jgi:hypothetical protein
MRTLDAIWADIVVARKIKSGERYEAIITPLIDELWATEDALGVKDPRTQ